MGLREADSIDMILQRPPFETEPCKLILMVIDATTGLDADTRFQMLVTKLAGYLAYVTSPEFEKDHPGMTAADVIVRVLTVTPPTTTMQQIDAIRSRDGTVRLRFFLDDYHDYMRRVKSMPRPGEPAGPSAN